MSKYDTLTSLLIASEFALPNKVVDSFTVCYTYYYWTLETGKLSYQLLSFLFRFFFIKKIIVNMYCNLLIWLTLKYTNFTLTMYRFDQIRNWLFQYKCILHQQSISNVAIRQQIFKAIQGVQMYIWWNIRNLFWKGWPMISFWM